MHTQTKYDTKLIGRLPIFSELDESDIVDIFQHNARIIRIVSYRGGEQLIMENQFDRNMFLVMKGKVRISKEVIRKDSKIDKEIQVVEGFGQFVGEISALTGKPRTATVTAVESTVCVVIDIALLMETSSQLLERVKHKFYPGLFESLCKRLADIDDLYVKEKQRAEDLEKRVFQVIKEKQFQNEKYMEELTKRRERIKRLEGELEEKNRDR